MWYCLVWYAGTVVSKQIFISVFGVAQGYPTVFFSLRNDAVSDCRLSSVELLDRMCLFHIITVSISISATLPRSFRFITKRPYAFLFSPKRNVCLAHLIALDLYILIIMVWNTNTETLHCAIFCAFLRRSKQFSQHPITHTDTHSYAPTVWQISETKSPSLWANTKWQSV